MSWRFATSSGRRRLALRLKVRPVKETDEYISEDSRRSDERDERFGVPDLVHDRLHQEQAASNRKVQLEPIVVFFCVLNINVHSRIRTKVLQRVLERTDDVLMERLPDDTSEYLERRVLEDRAEGVRKDGRRRPVKGGDDGRGRLRRRRKNGKR
jgi:hypothetical protein